MRGGWGGGRIAFTYIEGGLATGVIRNYEWIAGHLIEALRKYSSCESNAAHRPNSRDFSGVAKL